MNKAFTNFEWKDEPDHSTPLSAENLNSINNGLDEVDDRVITVTTKVENIILDGTTAPSSSTVGVVGQFYKNTSDGTFYQCTNVSGGTYTWSPSALNLSYSVVSVW